MIELSNYIQIGIAIVITYLYMRVKYIRYDRCIKWYKNLSKDLVKEWIQCEIWKQRLLFDILDHPEVIKYVKRNMLKQEQKKIEN